MQPAKQIIHQQYTRYANLHEQDNEDNQNNISNEIVEYIPQDNTPSDSINETAESNLLVHMSQQSAPIKDAQNDRLPGDLNRLISSNKNNTPTITMPNDKS